MFDAKSKQVSKQNVLPLCSDLEIASVVGDASKKEFMSICKASLKLATSTAIFSMLAGLNAQVARADHLNFTLYNETSKSIYSVYVSPARSDSWGSDILGTDVLMSGEYQPIIFPNETSDSPCIYDVQVVFEDDTQREGRYNLCEIESVNVR